MGAKRVSFRRSTIVAELTRQLYHNPAVVEVTVGDDIIIDLDKLAPLLHDLEVLFLRAVGSSAKEIAT